VLLILFFAFVTFFVYPRQEGALSSTQIEQDALAKVNPAYEETLPIQEVGGSQGRSIFIAFVMLSHVLFANLHLGGSWIAVITESFYLKNKKKRFDLLAKSVTLFNVILFSLGATFAIAGVLFFISLFPTFASNIFHVYWWPLLIEAILFALEIVFLYTFWFSWDKIDRQKHQILGYGYAITVFFQTLMINMLAGGMLTPGIEELKYASSGLLTLPLKEAMAAWFNPTLWRLQWHRVFASISYIGFILAMLAVFHYLDRKSREDKAYWDWVSSYGLNWGLLGLVIQPFLGLIYMLGIQDANERAFMFIMHGPRGWEMLLMVGALTFLFLSVILFFIEKREEVISRTETRNLHKAYKWFFWIALAAGFILIQPAWLNAPFIDDANAWQNPLGIMDFKYVALGALILIGVFLLSVDAIILGDVKEAHWGRLSRSARAPLILSGLLGMFIVLIMGFVRESARSPWTFYGIIPVAGGQSHPTPLVIQNIFIVWGLISVMILVTFWLTSKATAHHPEKAEEIT
ncbi:MAG: cytochrome ubiquinol oxidase subunit I, partial [Theionarchaea archaeon]|nr:cytochrome ubiquinol oxidase subunit I [Theionarchaea archaeon]